jgi:hypothetical protein
MPIIVQYANYTKKYKTFEEIENCDLVLEIDCSRNKLRSLPCNMP